jgi:hypothetical protein
MGSGVTPSALRTGALAFAAFVATTVSASANLQPVGDPLGKSWTLVFDDEFNGTAVDTSKWALTAFSNNNVTSTPWDCRESGGHLTMDLPGNGTGCDMSSTTYALSVGDYVEARIYFPGPGTLPTPTIYNWPGFWAASRNWPASGEIDIAEGLNNLTINYHSPLGAHNTGSPPGNWGNSWHVYGVYRAATQDQVYWDGKLVRTIITSDNGQPELIRLNIGTRVNRILQTGPAGDVLVDWVRAWR